MSCEDRYDSELTSLDTAAPAIAALAGYWSSRRTTPDALPAKSDMHPWHMKPYLGRLSIYGAMTEPVDFVFRLFGTVLVDLYGRDLTGRRVREISPPAYGELLLRNLTEALSRPEPTLHKVTITEHGFSGSYFRLTLPLADKAGEPAYLMTFIDVDHRRFSNVAHLLAENASSVRVL